MKKPVFPEIAPGARRRPSRKPGTYKVTLRRDVQQVTHVLVEALSPQEAVEIADSVSDAAAWQIEEHIGTHKPVVKRIHQIQPKVPAQKRNTP